MERHQRLQRAREDRGFSSATDAAQAFGWNRNTYISNENGNAPFSFKKAKEYAQAYGVRTEWLYEGSGAMKTPATPLARIIGKVGANPDGTILFTTGQETGDQAPIPPGGTPDAVALEVAGHSMRGWADDGALIYFEDQRTPPSPDMLGHVVVVETEDGLVLLKRLLRGGKPGRYDLESLNGPTLTDQRLVWAAHITAIIPPFQARRVIIRSGTEAA
ncbi:MAG: peptidase S24 [Caulobacteraceae bacterium]|nr:peptidase S24 [Caulobacteraceae bacterium]